MGYKFYIFLCLSGVLCFFVSLSPLIYHELYGPTYEEKLTKLRFERSINSLTDYSKADCLSRYEDNIPKACRELFILDECCN